jgi:hypothetical protein
MERKLRREPVFDLEGLGAKADAWKANGASRVVIEWSTGTGPTVFYYPAGERGFGVKWTCAVPTDSYTEVYADFIEHKLIPRIVDALKEHGLAATALCVDLQPLQVQRQRRHELERLEAAAH